MRVRMIPGRAGSLRQLHVACPGFTGRDGLVRPAVLFARHQKSVPVRRHRLLQGILDSHRERTVLHDDGRSEIILIEASGQRRRSAHDRKLARLRAQSQFAGCACVDQRRHAQALLRLREDDATRQRRRCEGARNAENLAAAESHAGDLNAPPRARLSPHRRRRSTPAVC